MISIQATLLRLYVNSDDRWERTPLYEAVVRKARTLGLAGASVFPVELGYGGHHRLHDASSEYTFVGSPVIIEIVDVAERVDALLTEIRPMVGEGLATTKPVQIVHQVHATGSSHDRR